MTQKETAEWEAKYLEEQKRAAELHNHCVKIRKAVNIGNGKGSGSVQRIKVLA